MQADMTSVSPLARVSSNTSKAELAALSVTLSPRLRSMCWISISGLGLRLKCNRRRQRTDSVNLYGFIPLRTPLTTCLEYCFQM